MQPSLFRTALVLGLLAAVGPFSIDMYLPALPAIGADLGADVAEVQRTLTLYFLAFGVFQMVYGPLADQFGRKPPLAVGMGIFLLGSVGCALAPDIGWLTAFRFLQGIGGASVMAIPRAVVRDRATGPEATRVMAAIMLVISISPMLAPLAGSAVLAWGSWREIFWVLAGVAILSLALILFAQPETLPKERRVRVNLRSMVRGGRRLLTDPVFMGLTFVGAFGFSSFFVFIASASFVYAETFDLTPTQFSLAFAVNAVGFFGASQLAAPIAERWGMVPMLRVACTGFAVFTLALFGIGLAGLASLPVIMVFLFCGNAFLGLVMPTTAVMSLDPHGEIAGLASSLGGTLQMVTGGLVVTLSSPFFDGTPVPMLGAIAACGALTMILARAVLPRVGRETAPV